MPSVFTILTRRELLTQPLSKFSKNLIKNKFLATINTGCVHILMFHITPCIVVTFKKTREEWAILSSSRYVANDVILKF